MPVRAPFWLEETAPFDASKHPRAGKGPQGGQFTKGQGDQQPQPKEDKAARAAEAKGRPSRKVVKRTAAMPKVPPIQPGRRLPVRRRSKGVPPMVIAASDQQPLEAADDPARLAKMIATAKGLGVSHWRLVMEWGQVVGPDGVDFSRYDKVVDAMAAAGISTELSVLGTATYHPQLDQQLSAANVDVGKARWFAQQVGAHYRGRVQKFSAWNEPNYSAFGALSPEKYRQVYKAMRDGFRGGNPQASVGFGEVAPMPDADAWLHKSLRGAGRVDRVTLHTYQFGDEPPENYSSMPSTLGINALDYAGAVVKSSGVRTREGKQPAVDITEMGYQGDQSRLPGAIKQANDRNVRQFTLYGLFGRPVGQEPPDMSISLDDYGNETAVPGAAKPVRGGSWDTSLVDGEGNPRASYLAAQAAVRRLRARPRARRKGASRARVREDAFWL